MAFDVAVNRGPQYRLGWAALALCLGIIITALGFEYLGGYKPCPLCLMQRYAYYASIPVLFVAIALGAGERGGLAAALYFLVALAFLGNAGFAAYHAGAEWQFWPGPDSCSGTDAITTSADQLLAKLGQARVVRCDEPAIRILGLSFAGWNVIASLLIMTVALKAAFAAAPATAKVSA